MTDIDFIIKITRWMDENNITYDIDNNKTYFSSEYEILYCIINDKIYIFTQDVDIYNRYVNKYYNFTLSTEEDETFYDYDDILQYLKKTLL